MTSETLIDQLRDACRLHQGGEPSEALCEVCGDLIRHSDDDVSILGSASALLPALPLEGAAWLAVVLAAAIERGEGVELTAPAVLDLFRTWLAKLPVTVPSDEQEGDEPEPTIEQASVISALPPLCQSLVAHVARMPDRRAELARDASLLQRLDELERYSHGISWVREMLQRCSGTLLVLHQPSGIGYRLRYENVANRFHLFSLIQTAVGQRIPGGRSPDPDIAAAARGLSALRVGDDAWWHYGDPRSKTANLVGSIRGEGLVRLIPFVNGEQVIILWPPLLQSRSWDAGFFGPHLEALPSELVVHEQLSADESRTWFELLGIQVANQHQTDHRQLDESALDKPVARPWWKLW